MLVPTAWSTADQEDDDSKCQHVPTRCSICPTVFITSCQIESNYIYIYICVCVYYRRKFRCQTSDNMDRWKAEQGRGREKRKIRRKNSRRERVRRKKVQAHEKVGKSRNTVFFQWFGAPEGRKVGSLKQRLRSQLARWEMKNCTPLWREAHLQVKMYKTPQLRTTFGSCDVEKVHAVVARSTFASQNVQNTSASDHFGKLWCRKSARRCGAKHISKSKCTKHTIVGPLLEVVVSKECTPLWREAHFQVKMYKTPQLRTTFGSCHVEKVHAVVARSTFPSQNVQSTTCSRHFWRFGCWKKVHVVCGAKHISKSKCTKHHMFAPLLEVRMSKKCTSLWRETHFEVKMDKTHHGRTTFGSCDVEKVHAVVARNTFRSQNGQNTPWSDHFWKLSCGKSARRCGAKHISKSKCTKRHMFADHFWRFGCWKSARRCGAKHISKSKCTKHHMFAPLLEVRMSKKCTSLWPGCGAKHISKSKWTKHTMVGPLLEVVMSKECTPLWREAHFQVKMYKTPQLRTTFGSCHVEKVHAVVARSTFPSQNVQSTTCSRHFWRFGCWKSARVCGAKHISKSKCTKHHMFAPLLEVRMSKKCTSLWRETHFEVKIDKTHHGRTTFGSWDVEKVHAVVASKCTKH